MFYLSLLVAALVACLISVKATFLDNENESLLCRP